MRYLTLGAALAVLADVLQPDEVLTIPWDDGKARLKRHVHNGVATVFVRYPDGSTSIFHDPLPSIRRKRQRAANKAEYQRRYNAGETPDTKTV